MADEREAAAKSSKTPKGFYRFSGLLNYLMPKAPKKTKQKQPSKPYRYSDNFSPRDDSGVENQIMSPKRKKATGRDHRYRCSDEVLSPRTPYNIMSPMSPAGGAGALARKHATAAGRRAPKRSSAEHKHGGDAVHKPDLERHQAVKQKATAQAADFRSPLNVSRHEDATQQMDTLTDMTGILSPPAKPNQHQRAARHPDAAAPWPPPNNDLAWRLRELFPQDRIDQRGPKQYDPISVTPWKRQCVSLVLLATAVIFVFVFAASLRNGGPLTTTETGTDNWGGSGFYPVGSKTVRASPSPSTPGKTATNHLCVYRASAEGRRPDHGASAYGLRELPLDTCNVVVYCCARLDEQHGLEMRAGEEENFEFLYNASVARRPWQQVKVLIGDGFDQLELYLRLLDEDTLLEKFAQNTAPWCKNLGYSGVVINWPHLHLLSWDTIVAALGVLQKLFKQHSLTVGTVMPLPAGDLYTPEVAVPDLSVLSNVLGEASILLRPPTYEKKDFYLRTFSFYAARRLRTLSSMALSAGSVTNQGSLCVMVPAAALAFRVNNPEVATVKVVEAETSLGPAPASEFSPPGIRSLYEACARTSKLTVHNTSYSVLAAGNGLWLSYTSGSHLSAFLDDAKEQGFTCGGVWDSEMDDFPNYCGRGAYPLMAATAAKFFEPQDPAS